MPPEALAPARCPDASAPDAASRDAEAFLASAREAAMEKLRRKRRVQKRREEKNADVASLGQSPNRDATREPPQTRPVPKDDAVSDPKRHVPQLRLRAIVTPGASAASCTGDAPPPLPTAMSAAASRSSETKKIETKKRAGVAAAAVVGDAVVCGLEDGDVVAYRLGDVSSSTAVISREAWLAFPEDCGDAASVRLIHPVSVEAARDEQTNEAPLRKKSVSVVVAYDSGAWCVFSLRFPFLEKNAEEMDSSAVVSRGLRLSLVTACPPHVAFSDAYKYRKRAPWSPSTRRPSIGAALADGRGETLFFASPVVGDNDVYAWDVAAISSASKKKEYREDDDDDEEKNETVPARDKEGVSFRSPPVTKTALTAAPSKTTESGSLFAMQRHTDKVTCLAFLDQRNTRVVSGGNDKALVEWRKLERARDEPSARKEKEKEGESEKENTWRAARSVAAPGGAIRALCVSETPTNARAVDNAVYNVYTAGSDGAVRAWEVSDETGFVLLRTFVGGHDGFGVCVRAVRLPVNFFSSPFFRHDAADAKTKTACVEYEDYVVSGCEGNAGGYWVAGDGSLKLWRAADGRCAQTVSAQRGDVTGIVVFGDKNAPDACLSALNEETRSASKTNGKLFCRLVTASKDGTVAHFDLETRAELPGKGIVKGATGEDGEEDGDGRPASFAWTKGFL